MDEIKMFSVILVEIVLFVCNDASRHSGQFFRFLSSWFEPLLSRG